MYSYIHTYKYILYYPILSQVTLEILEMYLLLTIYA